MAVPDDAPDDDDAVGRLLSGYRTHKDVPDELLEADGSIRPVWKSFIEAVARMDADELRARQARGDQYLRDAGVYYRQYGATEAAERDWPLSHVPVLIDEDEWAEIGEGLVQRAELLERIIADVYGPNRLVERGQLPPALLAQNPEWLRPLVGVTPRGGHFLHFLAFDIGRGPQGQWWVLGDRAQAPSGAGFALENRIATTRIYADHFARANVHRLAGFFRAFRDALINLRDSELSRVGILTPGPLNDTYFEHAYIARYLGFMLLEGDDLTVVDGRLMVRTVAGLQPVSVLWRRLDSVWADPLELEETSAIGTPGMLGAVRTGGVTLVNALGSGVLETRALLAFMPRLAETLLGEPLRLPNIATWWCGQDEERDYVKANAHRMTIGNAFATRLLFDLDDVSVPPATDPAARLALGQWIERHAEQLVAQETVTLSTTPALDDGRLVPRPMSLRVFLARTRDGWSIMPGGFARIGPASDAVTLTMQNGGSAADVWVVSKSDVATESMLASPTGPYLRQQQSMLPSRAADSLYWLGRYVERAEYRVRLLRAHHVRVSESISEDMPLLRRSAEYLTWLGSDPSQPIPDGVRSTLESAARAASNVRDRFSVDGWTALDELSKTVQKLADRPGFGDDTARALSLILRNLSGFTGLVYDNMYRFSGWRFMSIGRSLERALSLTGLLSQFADEDAPDGALDLAVEVADSEMSHRRRYAVSTNRATVVDLLALDPLNPRSIIYQLNEIWSHLGYLPGGETTRQLSPLQRAALQTRTNVAVQTPEGLDQTALSELEGDIATMSDLVGETYFR
ncbi:circularly permuted type 2 ATP-grasp protein [Acuticoccus sediminis]|uniref:circularly permuted type 2 ATP-grasp protein n=1 Tax=Acuticoccus sediminis TaxID=2184697 RepID=UPI001CFE97D0|nr:circularly permuted type 2 ATP-grasp protein [Acuticoccus sediminis]